MLLKSEGIRMTERPLFSVKMMDNRSSGIVLGQISDILREIFLLPYVLMPAIQECFESSMQGIQFKERTLNTAATPQGKDSKIY